MSNTNNDQERAIDKDQGRTADVIMQKVQDNIAKKERLSKVPVAPTTVSKSVDKNAQLTRNLILVGCGDGGCHIVSDIREATNSVAIAYNTSARGMDNINADIKIIPSEEDGSGKVREYSQEVFRKGSYKELLNHVVSLTTDSIISEYVIVVSTVDGGTGGGVSPMVSKFLSDNIDTPVILVGVYPALTEDSTAQFNAMCWQKEVESYGIPYMIFDNDGFASKMEAHVEVNRKIVETMKILTGVPFSDTEISTIDNRDMYMLVNHIGGRIVVVSENKRPTLGESIDDFLMNVVTQSSELPPVNTRGIGLFIKGPEEFIKQTDTSLRSLRGKYGDAAVQYQHLEISETVTIALICTGCSEPYSRLRMMRQRYDDINSNMKQIVSQIDDALDGITNPLGLVTKKVRDKTSEPDLGALGL